MKTFTKEELKTILENHRHWLNEDCDGWEDMRANLRSADLSCANLSGANLSGADLRSANLWSADLRSANLSGANLSGANPRRANLSGANLSDANLSGADLWSANLRSANLWSANLRSADLSGANLRSANLRSADLSCANLSGANLSGADLRSADLSCANLSGANLWSANLWSADLSGADLSGADLWSANLRSAINIPFIPYACPDFGAFIGYKKAKGYIVELEILADAKRCSATTRKCRCNKAKVLSIQNKNGTNADITEVASNRDSKFIYKVGEIVEVKDFDDDRWNECSTGIHFFINRREAVEY